MFKIEKTKLTIYYSLRLIIFAKFFVIYTKYSDKVHDFTKNLTILSIQYCKCSDGLVVSSLYATVLPAKSDSDVMFVTKLSET